MPVQGRYTAKEVLAFYRSLNLISVKQPKDNARGWNQKSANTGKCHSEHERLVNADVILCSVYAQGRCAEALKLCHFFAAGFRSRIMSKRRFARLMLAQGNHFVILSARKTDVVWTSHSDQLLYATLIALLGCDANACVAGRCPRPDMPVLLDIGRP